MKILQITPSLINGGAERFTIDLSNQLVKYGYDITIITLEGKTDNDLTLDISPKVNLIRLKKVLGFDFKCFKKINSFIRRNNFDVIHTHTRALNYVSPISLFTTKSKFVHTVHNSALNEEKYYLIRKYRNLLFKLKCVFPVTISIDSDNSFKNEYNSDSNLIFNGTRIVSKTISFESTKNEVNNLKINSKTKVFVNIARVSKQKNQEILVKAFERFQSNSENVILLIIGRLTDNEYLEKIKAKMPSNVHLLGSRANATDFLFLADAFCLSSRWEGMPISLIESFCCGTIPICTPVGGVRDMILNKNNGFLTEDVSENSIYQSLREFLKTDTNQLDIIKLNCLDSYHKKYSMKICAKNYSNLYKIMKK